MFKTFIFLTLLVIYLSCSNNPTNKDSAYPINNPQDTLGSNDSLSLEDSIIYIDTIFLYKDSIDFIKDSIRNGDTLKYIVMFDTIMFHTKKK